MSSGSTKDLHKVLQAFFASSVSPNLAQTPHKSEELPEGLVQTVHSYVQKHPSLEESELERLQEELLAIYQKTVVNDKTKLADFLRCLCLLSSLIKRQRRLDSWWNIVIAPVITGTGNKIAEIQYATEFLLSVLDYDEADDKTANKAAETFTHFVNLLLEAYLRRTKAPDPGSHQLTLDDALVARQLEDILVAFGRKKPKSVLRAIDHLLVERNSRMQALGLLSALVRQQPPHLHVVVETSLVEHLLKCLMIDTSTTVISLALACLIMFLPHIPISVKQHLPRLFLIYSRLLCWDRFAPMSLAESVEGDNTTSTSYEVEQESSPADEEDWVKLASSFDAAESTAPELLHYFTFLYGLYPLNFVAYIRKPRRYLKDIGFPRAEEFDLDQTVIRARTEQFRRLHLIHPNFYHTTAEEELTDNRWLKSDPSDVVSECMSLVISASEVSNPALVLDTASAFPEIPPHLLHDKDIPRQSLLDKDEDSVLSNESFENAKPENLVVPPLTSTFPALRAINPSVDSPSTHSFAASSPRMFPVNAIPDSPTLPGPLSSIAFREGSMQRNESNSSLPSASNLSPRVAAVSRSQMPRSPAVRPAPQTEANMAFLQREVMLLRSDLNFERFLKQQHLSHIGQLQRNHIKEATVEAETQNLINTNRALKAQLAKANEAYGSLKKETATGRSQAKKLEAELSTRVRTLREDEKQWRAEEEALRVELRRAKSDRDYLRQLIVDSEAKELLARQELSLAQFKLGNISEMQSTIAELEQSIRDYESKEMMYESAQNEKESLRLELAAANILIENQSADQSLAE